MSTDLADIKAGDQVIVNTRTLAYVAKVDRVTATQIVIGHSKYRRKNGQLIGGSAWDTNFLSSAEGQALRTAEQQMKAYEAFKLMQRWGFRALCNLGEAELTSLLHALRSANKTLKAISK